ncbi:MAG TPA: polygalacturonase [Lachnospiraceae bacterium]|nr:polygalacturonase [Lachnospiraceae bacterium]
MNFEVRAITARSVTIELENEAKYSCMVPVKLYLDGVMIKDDIPNVYSIFGLEPDREYRLLAVAGDEEEIGRDISHSGERIKTAKETVLLNVRDFGAKGDGICNDTSFIQSAVLSCPPGGTVYFPGGTYLTGPVFLKSNINLWLDRGAVLFACGSRSLYPVLPGMTLCTDEDGEYNLGSWEGNPLDTYASLITGIEAENVNIFGEGTVDGGGDRGDWWKDEKLRRGAWRPRTVFLCRCRNILLQGITVRNSPSWTIHPYYSDELRLYSLKIRNPSDAPNTDGIDPESCRSVEILGADISVGDDCIAIKSGKYYMALKHHKPCEDIIVRNCLLQSGHGSVTIGSECAGGIYRVHVSGCVFNGTDRGMRIKTRRGRGRRAVIDDIVFEHILMKDVKMPFVVNMFYFCDPDGHSDYVQSRETLPVDDMTPRIEGIRASDIVCKEVSVCFLCAYGLPEEKIGEISLSDINASYKEPECCMEEVPAMMDGLSPMKGKGIFIRNAKRVSLENVELKGISDIRPDVLSVDSLEVKDA